MACFASVRVFFVVFTSYILQSSAFTTLLSPAMRGKGSSLHRHLRRRRALFVSSPPQNSSSGMRDYRISKPVRREVELEVQAEESERKSEHTHFMRLALRHAQHAFREKEVPIGAVIADSNGKIIATGRNQVEKHQDPTAHAEMICLRQATEIEKTWRLPGHTLYTTLEPCPMCMGALLQSRLDRIVYAAKDLRLGAAGSYIDLVSGSYKHPFHDIKIEGGLLEKESSSLLTKFFLLRRREGLEIQGGKNFIDRGYQFRGSFDEWEK